MAEPLIRDKAEVYLLIFKMSILYYGVREDTEKSNIYLFTYQSQTNVWKDI